MEKNRDYKTISAITDWIEKNNNKKLNINDIAAKSGYSVRYIQHMFKEITNISMGAYCRMRRLTAAATKLRTSTLKVADISLQSGFDSHPSFSKAFIRQFGVSPVKFRNHKYWNFDKFQPRFDQISHLRSVSCSTVMRGKMDDVLSASTLEALVARQQETAHYIKVSSAGKRLALRDGRHTSSSHYILAEEDSTSPPDQSWFLIKMKHDPDRMQELQAFIYSVILPFYGVTRRNEADLIQVRKDRRGAMRITGYLVPCLQSK